MNLVDEYGRQFRWRRWASVFRLLPPVAGETILDLGCGIGDLTAEFVARGARVIAVDGDRQLVEVARSRRLPGAEFLLADLRETLDLAVRADGLWCSFTAAYFPDLPAALVRWGAHLKPGAWVALTEVDDLFGHRPLGRQTTTLLEAYAEDSLAAGRYDFRMGRKLESYLERAGFAVSSTLTLADPELSFRGPCSPEVLQAWRDRLQRMALLRRFCGVHMEAVQEDLLRCLSSDDHLSLAKVYCCIAYQRPPSG